MDKNLKAMKLLSSLFKVVCKRRKLLLKGLLCTQIQLKLNSKNLILLSRSKGSISVQPILALQQLS